MRHIKSPFLFKLILFMITLCAFSAITTSFLSYSKFSHVVRKQTEIINANTLSQLQITIEQSLNILESYMSDVLNQPEVLALVSSKSSDLEYLKVITMVEKKRGVMSGDVTPVDVYLISTEHGWLMSDRGIVTAPEAIPEKYGYIYKGNVSYESTWLFTPDNDIYPSPFASRNIDSINLIIRMPRFTPVADGVAVVNISVNSLSNLIAKQVSQSGVVILDDKYEPIYGKSIFAEGSTNLMEVRECLENVSERSGSFIVTSGKDSVTFLKSNYNGWTYLLVTDIAVITYESKEFFNFTVLVVSIIFLTVSLLAVLGSRMFYKPLKAIRERMAGISSKQYYGADEFEHINRWMTNSKEDMDRLIAENAEQMSELLVHRLFDGRLDSELLEQRKEQLGLKSDWVWMYVISVRIGTLKDSFFREYDDDVGMFAINNVICELISTSIRIRTVIIRETLVILCGSNEIKNETAHTNMVENAAMLKRELKNYFGLKVNIGLSRLFYDPLEAPNAYMEAMEALAYCDEMGDDSIIDIMEVKPSPHVRQVFSEKKYDELLSALRNKNRQEAKLLTNYILTDIFTNFNSDNGAYMAAIGLISRIIAVYGIENSCVNLNEFYPLLLKAKRKENFEKLALDYVIEPIINVEEEESQSREKRLSDRVIELVQSEYRSNLSLEDCAERLHYNANYISRIFKKETGLSFKEYLMDFRLNEAKRLLIETDLKIAEIAENLNYNNTQNFIRYFKNIEGITPKAYRETNKADKNND